MRRATGLILALLVGSPCGCGPRLDGKLPYERHLALVNLAQGAGGAGSEALTDPDWRVAATACTLALIHSLDDVASAALRLLADGSIGDPRLEYLLRVAGTLGHKRHAAVIKRYLRHSRPTVRLEALRALAPEHLGSRAVVAWIIPLARDRDKDVKDRAITILHHFRTRQARITVALHAGEIAELAKIGATLELYRLIVKSDRAGRQRIVDIALKSPRPNTKLWAAILPNDALSELHPLSYKALKRGGKNKALADRLAIRIKRRWTSKIQREVELCATRNWYPSFTRLKAWTQRPAFDFLATALQQARQSCKRAALDLVGKEIDQGMFGK